MQGDPGGQMPVGEDAVAASLILEGYLTFKGNQNK